MFNALVNIEHLINKKAPPARLCRPGNHQREYAVKRCATGLSGLPSVAEAVGLPSL
jgi:hypothetical protein